ncbi:beta-ketoacyl-ACP synthase II [Hydrogenovibrio marinus]|uniref:3-oxoacyl-[acyl-carrier-protein] synthase 2 n=1 Tax=Hydrogenovibrio marinus TaxID=28885 RepID=A0A066ZTC7_HYDMR|nr:beta-ketoacyl-ACP synthase II [Hydrogenovibrio marinus]KDN95539.1 3-oxoacyl-ACP synthase [Hydrogenovibrio marinus]BBN60033.1 3-oxoacyl-[acyl-carrier-protein] synthase 2 [Hydrogenovibrio marinus]
MRRVVITGVGCVTPMGNNTADSWAAVLAGKSGIDYLKSFNTEGFAVTFGGEVKDFDVTQVISAKDAKKMDPFIHYGMVAGTEALKDSGLEVTEENAHRIGVSIGSGIGGIGSIEKQHETLSASGPRRVSPFFVPSAIVNMVSGNFSIMHGLKGPNMAIATACATGTHSIGDSFRMIQMGDADVMLAGGAEHAATPLGLAGFAAAKALSTRNDDPKTASRPWDKDRDGFVLSDGAGVVVLEEYEHAKARGAKIYCEVIGFGMSGDAYHMTKPAEGGAGGARAIQNAINNAKLNPEQVDYINAHGTSTPAGDVCEVGAVKSVFGQHAYNLAMSSTKSVTGHALGAAGAMEAVFVAKAIEEQVLPPTMNLENPDEGCDLDFVAGEARQSKLNYAVSNSLGFGGTNATLVFAKI